MHASQASKFALAGAIGAVIDFSLLNFFVWAWQVDPRIGNIFSTLIASVFVFIINKYVAFKHRAGNVRSQASRFLFVYLLAYVLNVSLTAFLITFVSHLMPTLSQYVVANGCKAASIGIVMFWNYFLLHSFVFKAQDKREAGR